MNTKTIKLEQEDLINSWEQLIEKEKEQAVIYFKQEGITDEPNLNYYKDQEVIKNLLCVRMNEEIWELSDAMDNNDHKLEELADVINFFFSFLTFTENLVVNFNPFSYFLSKIHSERYILGEGEIDNLLYITYKVIHNLKNRPWTETNYCVNETKYVNAVKELINSFIKICNNYSDEDIFKVVAEKIKVNMLRRETNY